MRLGTAGFAIVLFGMLGCGAGTGPGDFASDFKTSSSFLTNMTAPVKGTSPHGTVRIWYSSNLKDLLANTTFTAPEGSVSIKEADPDNNGTVDALVVMIKKPAGYDAANGDWYYDVRDTAGTVKSDPAPGKIQACIDCHKKFSGTDYLGGTKMK